MICKPRFHPLCDVHHVRMRRVMLEEDSEAVRSYHTCERRDCTRVFRASRGYSDRIGGEFDESRSVARACPQCGAALYLADVERTRKVETWECPGNACEFSEESSSPAAR